MFKRLRWLSIGFVFGAGSSYAVARRLRRAVQHYAPPQVVDRLGMGAANVRHAMRLREAQLRAEVGRRWQ
jgi:hypothetical protein